MIALSETNQKGIGDPCQSSSTHPSRLVLSASLPLGFLGYHFPVVGHLLEWVAALELVVVAKLVVLVPAPILQRLGTMP